MENISSTDLIPPPNEDFVKFTQESCKLVDWSDSISNKFNCKFYVYKNVVFDEVLLSGHYESTTVNVNNSIVVASFLKTGTTWLQEITFLIANDGDLSKSDLIPITERVPFLEYISPLTVEDINKSPTPKLLKTHLPHSLLTETFADKNFKILYICRNPKDTITSYYFFYKMTMMYKYSGQISDFVDLFVNDLGQLAIFFIKKMMECILTYFDMQPLIAYSPFANHVLEYWRKSKSDGNILFLQYEDLQLDLKSNVKKIAQFMGKTLSEQQIEKIANRCTFASMSSNAMSNYSHLENVAFDKSISKFMRKGKVGDWKNHLSKEDNRKIDEWIDKKFKNTDLKFIYE